MELQLALSLSSSSSSSDSQFHLNNSISTHPSNPMKMEDHLHHHFKKRKLSVNGHHHDDDDDEHDDDDDEHDDGFHIIPQTLPLLFCNNPKYNQQLLHEDDDNNDDDVQSTFIFMKAHKNCEEEKGVIGWPPVKSSMKRLCHQKNGGGGGGGDGGGGGSKSMYVKVQMEGVGIARKIDLNLHYSYHTLTDTLAHMFGKCNEDVKLTYQDKEGDWLLAGDVPWGSFVKTVQRLKLLKSNC